MDRRFYKVNLADILFIGGLKDYVIIQMQNSRIITRMTINNIYEWLPKEVFMWVNRSFIVNKYKLIHSTIMIFTSTNMKSLSVMYTRINFLKVWCDAYKICPYNKRGNKKIPLNSRCRFKVFVFRINLKMSWQKHFIISNYPFVIYFSFPI